MFPGCAELANGNGITLNDFHFLNPQINANCSNMWAGKSLPYFNGL